MSEHSLTIPPDFLNLARLIVTSLSLDDHADHAKGKLVAFIERERPGAALAVGPLYKTLYEELRRRANYEKQGLDYDGILKHKSISRNDFTQIMARVPEVKKIENDWPTINAQLSGEGLNFLELKEIWDCCRKYEIERMNRRNRVILALRDVLRKSLVLLYLGLDEF